MSRSAPHPDDPRFLIGEAFRIDGIGAEDCRSIFFDWALGLPAGRDAKAAATALIAHYEAPEGHPMSGLLREAATAAPRKGRRRRRH